ncbi:hypothetical protein [Domibacillus sp. PGB-M46]|nr:hypothetical protein [Domibacillus sp. PGB-M46]
MRLGFIGFGEVTFELSTSLRQEGVEMIFIRDVMLNHPTFDCIVY